MNILIWPKLVLVSEIESDYQLPSAISSRRILSYKLYDIIKFLLSEVFFLDMKGNGIEQGIQDSFKHEFYFTRLCL